MHAALRDTRLLIATAFLFIAAVGWLAQTRMFSEPTRIVDYNQALISLCESHQPDGDNVSQRLESVSERVLEVLHEVGESAGSLPHIGNLASGPWRPDQFPAEVAALDRLRSSGIFDELLHFCHMPRCIPDSREITLTQTFDDFLVSVFNRTDYRNIGLALIAESRRLMAAGQTESAIDHIDAALRIARFGTLHPQALTAMASSALRTAALRTLRSWADAESLDSESVSRAMSSVVGTSLDHLPAYLLDVARLEVLAEIQATYTDDGSGDGRALPYAQMAVFEGWTAANPPGTLQGAVMRIRNLLPSGQPSRAEVTDRLEEHIRQLKRLSNIAPVDRLADSYKQTDFAAYVQNNDVMALMEAGATYACLAVGDSARLFDAATKVTLALRLYRIRHGTLPGSLSDLSPEFLVEPILDPITNLPFGYLHLSHDRSDRPYLLYSLGLDRLDQHGTVAPDVDRKGQLTGKVDNSRSLKEVIPFDYVVNLPDDLD